MKHTCKTLSLAGFALAASFTTASADALHTLSKLGQAQIGNVARADGHAPIGVMGDHMHKQGEWMFSYRFMQMHMDGNRSGTSGISDETIATTIGNPFFGTPGQPPTLRVVPTEMTTDMHMFGAMYAPTDNLTLMAMVNYLDREMDHTTFQGAAGTTVLGEFRTRTSGFADTRVGGLYRLFDNDVHHLHMNVGLSIPTGSITEVGQVLAPNGMTPTLRLPYPMQLGTGTFDFLPGLTYTGQKNAWAWGAQYRAEIRTESENSEGYAFGDKHAVSAWASHQWAPWVSTSLRVDMMTQDGISGSDANIVAPVQTANVANSGGQRIDMHLGVNLIGQKGIWKNHRLAAEIGMPVYQNVKGVQLETDYVFSLGWQKAF